MSCPSSDKLPNGAGEGKVEDDVVGTQRGGGDRLHVEVADPMNFDVMVAKRPQASMAMMEELPCPKQ
jgi:hypothetical protein